MKNAIAARALRQGLLVLVLGGPGTLSCGSVSPPPAARPTSHLRAAPVDPRLMEAAKLEEKTRQAIAARMLPAASEMAWAAARARRDALGPTHPEVERTLLLCAWLDEQRGAPDQAVEALRGAGRAMDARRGARSVEAAALLDRIARIELRRNRLDDARSAAEAALAMREALPEATHLEVARSMVLLGGIAAKQCRLTEAETRLRGALAIAESLPQSEPLLLADALDKLGEARRLARADAEAEELWKRAIAVLATVETAEYSWLIALHNQLATHAEVQGDRAAARAWAEQALAVAERHVVSNAPDPRVAPGIMVADYMRLEGDSAGAEAIYARIGRKERAWGTPPKGAASAMKTEGPLCASKTGNVSNAQQVVAEMRPAFRDCYNAALRQNPDYTGSLRLVAKIGPGGEVTSVRAVALLRDPDRMIDCLLNAVASARFNPPEGGMATVVIPVTLISQ